MNETSPSVSVFDRLPPHSLEAEESVLGSLLLSHDALVEVSELLKPEDFYKEAHATIYRVALELYAKGEPVDPLTVSERLRSHGLLERAGDRPYIIQLASSVPTPANARHYAEIVAKLATYRRLIEAAAKVMQRGFEAPEDINAALDEAEDLIYSVAQRKRRERVRPINELMERTFEELERIATGQADTGLKTGFVDLDRLIVGMQPSDLIVIAARPSMGKTSLALNIADHVAVEEGVPVAIFSLEMSAQEVTKRLLCSRARINGQRLKTGDLDDEAWQRLSEAAGELTSARIFIDDTADMGIMELRSKVRRLKALHDIGLVIVDYLQLMRSDRRLETRAQEIAAISRGLKILGRDFEIPVIAVSQLTRDPERHNRKPILSDLRESGAIEQDADMIIFIHRESAYNRGDEENKGKADIIVAKNRNGPTDSITLSFQDQYARFFNMSTRRA